MKRLSRRGFISAAITAPLASALPGVVAREGAALRAAVASAVQVPEFILFREGLEALARELRRPMPRPDLVVIDGVGYGPDDQLPPPFGSC